ncbi:FadR/GntR family transcriptional regulator [Microlunatus sp. GCM10028923]|uniref:FadR/GntR family transcriptional regulator n=1 Tax=Microlunatus sp. GCM10028923 TaxID=3273400 RepID=UPI00360D6107
MSGAAAEERSYRRPAPPKVEDLLKAYIIDHGFQSGDRLPTEAAFGEALGVSRNAIREAMRSLQSLGILEIRHGYGAYLAEVSLPRLADGLAFWGKLLSRDGGDHVIRRIAEVRSLVEAGLVTEVAGRLTEADFADLRESIEEIEAAAEQDQRAYDADRRFHEILYRPLDNWVLIGFLRSLWDSTREITQEQPPGPDLALAPRHHRAILEGLEAGDGAAAAEAMREHFGPMLRGDYDS